MDNYYTPLSDDVFDEVKRGCIAVWNKYDDTYGYATGKIDRIKDLENIQDNGMSMVAMFDRDNRAKLGHKLSVKAKQELNARFQAGGGDYDLFKVYTLPGHDEVMSLLDTLSIYGKANHDNQN